MLIAAKSPSQEREELFWKMIDRNYVSCVVALEYEVKIFDFLVIKLLSLFRSTKNFWILIVTK